MFYNELIGNLSSVSERNLNSEGIQLFSSKENKGFLFCLLIRLELVKLARLATRGGQHLAETTGAFGLLPQAGVSR